MNTSLAINHDGVIQSEEFAPYTEQTRLQLNTSSAVSSNYSPKQLPHSLEIRNNEKEPWYIVSDGIVITHR